MTFAVILLCWVALGLLIEVVAVQVAPLGYEDDKGFHLGSNKVMETEDHSVGNPSLSAKVNQPTQARI